MSAAGEALQVVRWTWSHPANRGHRVRALTRAATFQFRGRVLRRPTPARVGRAMILADLHSFGASKAVYANPPDWLEMLVWKRRLVPGDLFIDVGANVGVYSLWAADSGAEVIALEPGPAVTALRRNLALNRLPVEVVQAAATNTAGPVAFDASGPDAVARLGGDETVAGVTLDSIIGDRLVAGVKIDVEGAERLVLEGAGRALAEHRLRCIQLEWNACSRANFGESRVLAKDLLRSHGYALHRPSPDGTLVPCDGEEGEDVFAIVS